MNKKLYACAAGTLFCFLCINIGMPTTSKSGHRELTESEDDLFPSRIGRFLVINDRKEKKQRGLVVAENRIKQTYSIVQAVRLNGKITFPSFIGSYVQEVQPTTEELETFCHTCETFKTMECTEYMMMVINAMEKCIQSLKDAAKNGRSMNDLPILGDFVRVSVPLQRRMNERAHIMSRYDWKDTSGIVIGQTIQENSSVRIYTVLAVKQIVKNYKEDVTFEIFEYVSDPTKFTIRRDYPIESEVDDFEMATLNSNMKEILDTYAHGSKAYDGEFNVEYVEHLVEDFVEKF